MKSILVAEYRAGRTLAGHGELSAFAAEFNSETAMFLVGSKNDLPDYNGTLYLADVEKYGEFNPDVHKQLLLEVIAREQPDMVVFSHSSYGWDLAPRVALALQAAQISEVVAVQDGSLIVPFCNGKLRRAARSLSGRTIVTLQAGAFTPLDKPAAVPTVTEISVEASGRIMFNGYEAAEQGGVDLGKSQIIVSAGRGIGKPEAMAMIADLAGALGGDYGASRPVVDAGWAEHNRQVGTTGQTVAPKLYVACGISGAIQHLAGMKKAEFVVAVNTDRDAPIGEVADVLIVADLKQFVPALTERLRAL